ncbi:hypothetical protein BDZ89DRAFT_246920 [Hymenopellis radicata]|nr:hypothetical protein BDZ89DRAFT_246920 [Hymenopellis radicata]
MSFVAEPLMPSRRTSSVGEWGDGQYNDTETLTGSPSPDFKKCQYEEFEPSPLRHSPGLIGAHLLHGLLCLVSLTFLVASLLRLEHHIKIPLDNVSYVTSAISVVSQVFWTGSVSGLYLITSSLAVDAAIRNPKTIIDLDFRLQAWTGLGSSVANGLFSPRRFKDVSRMVLLAIPVYFGAGEVLKISSSSVLGINVYDSVYNFSAPVRNHVTPFTYPTLAHRDQKYNKCQDFTTLGSEFYGMQDMWRSARHDVRVTYASGTTQPGLLGNLLHDLPAWNAKKFGTFNAVEVNATKMNVQCGLIDTEQLTFYPDPNYAAFSAADNGGSNWNYYVEHIINKTVGYNLSGSLQPTRKYSYGNSTKPPLSLSFDWAIEQPDIQNPSGSMKLYVQSWNFADRWDSIERGVSSDFVFMLAARDPVRLLHDSTGLVGNISTVTVGEIGLEHWAWCHQDGSSDADCRSMLKDNPAVVDHEVQTYFQTIGCTLTTSEATVPLSQTSQPQANFTVHSAPPHQWSQFSWTDSNPTNNTDFLAREFLEMFVSAPCEDSQGHPWQDRQLMGDVLMRMVRDDQRLNVFESRLENMTASYLWNTWQLCDSLFEFGTPHPQCVKTTLDDSMRLNAAEFKTARIEARLEIVVWKAVVTLVCSLLLSLFTYILLGPTRRTPDEPLLESRFLATAGLLNDSWIPDTIAAGTPRFEMTRIRYVQDSKNGVGAKLDVYETL